MRARMFFVPVLAMALAAGCANDPTGVESAIVTQETEALYAVVQKTSAVTQFAAGPEIPGASARLKISSNGVGAWFRTHGLIPGNAYTLWMVVFNNPENCITPNACVLADFMANDPAVATDLMNAGSLVAGGSGKGTFAGRVSTGQLGDRSVGLLDPTGAIIHLVVRDHGPKLSGNAQLSLFGGGCDVNACANVQDAFQF